MARTKMNKEKIEWFYIDAKDQVLGRLASDIAKKLLAKHKAEAAVNQAARIKVVVVNTDQIYLSGNKEKDKTYYHYTGYPGGLKHRNVSEQRARDSRIIVRNAVLGMLPKNKLRGVRINNLLLYRAADHPHHAQIN